jgi:hypothetical protein
MAFLYEEGVVPPPPITTDSMPSPRRGKDSLGVVRFGGMAPRKPHKLKAIEQDLMPKECFSARDGVRKGAVFDMDMPNTQPKSISARDAFTRKVCAIDLDLGFSSSEATRTVAIQATKTNREKKDVAAQLRTLVHTKEQHLEGVQAEIETTARATAKVKASLEKLQTEHAILQARHTWAKSSLDSALGAQEEYKRHYESVETSLAKAKSEIARQEELLQSVGQEGMSSAVENAKAELSLRETQLEGELIMVEQTKRLTVLKLKEKSKAILECMAATQQISMAQVAFQHWMHAVQQERAEAENAEQTMATHHSLRQLEDRRRQLVFAAAERLASATFGSLASITLRAWAQQAQESSMMASVSPFRALLRGGDASPQPAAIASTMSRPRRADACGSEDDALKQHQAKHRGMAASVLQRLADAAEAALVSQVLCCWSNAASEARTERSQEVETQATFAGLEAALQALHERLQGKSEELEDANAALQDTYRNNREVISACKGILELQTSVADAFTEIEAMVYEE